jgi:hypothetical protein
MKQKTILLYGKNRILKSPIFKILKIIIINQIAYQTINYCFFNYINYYNNYTIKVAIFLNRLIAVRPIGNNNFIGKLLIFSIQLLNRCLFLKIISWILSNIHNRFPNIKIKFEKVKQLLIKLFHF